jgi:hypothetical protein
MQESFKGLISNPPSGLHPVLALLSVIAGPQAAFPQAYDKHSHHNIQQ